MTRMLTQTCATLLLALTLLFPLAAAAQDKAPARTEDLQKLVSTLENDGDRQKLVAQLKILMAAQHQGAAEEDSGVLAVVSDRLEALGDDLMDAVGALRDLPRLAAWAGQQMSDPTLRGRWLDTAGRLLALLAAAIAADQILRRLLRRAEGVTQPREAAPPLLLVRLPLGLARAVLRTLPVAGAAAAAWGMAGFLGLPTARPSAPRRTPTCA